MIVLADQNVTTTGWWAIGILAVGALVTFVVVARWAYRQPDYAMGETEDVGLALMAALTWPLLVAAYVLRAVARVAAMDGPVARRRARLERARRRVTELERDLGLDVGQEAQA